MQNIGSGIAYTYGIDDKGKMYVWDKWGNKMVYYGDPQKGAGWVRDVLVMGHDAKMNWEGDKTNGAWKQPAQQKAAPASNTGGGYVGGGGYAAPVKVLDQAQLDSLDSLIASLATVKDRAFQKARVKRDTGRSEKKAERDREHKKYQGKKISTLQDFNSAKVDTDLNTTATLENLISSLSTLGLGGSRALTRQILDAANKSNRKANETQATNTQGLDSAWNEYQAGYESDLDKIDDQYGFDTGEAEKAYLTGKQNALYKKADVYNAVDDTANRSRLMNEARGLNDNIADSAFVNPKYTGKRRAMDTPDLADYNQDIATYETALDIGDGVTPLATDGTTGAGNLAVKAIAVNDKDLGIKKKTEAELGYGV